MTHPHYSRHLNENTTSQNQQNHESLTSAQSDKLNSAPQGKPKLVDLVNLIRIKSKCTKECIYISSYLRFFSFLFFLFLFFFFFFLVGGPRRGFGKITVSHLSMTTRAEATGEAFCKRDCFCKDLSELSCSAIVSMSPFQKRRSIAKSSLLLLILLD